MNVRIQLDAGLLVTNLVINRTRFYLNVLDFSLRLSRRSFTNDVYAKRPPSDSLLDVISERL